MHFWSAVSGWINWGTDNERGIGPYQDMDTISMLLTGWVIFIVISVALAKYLYFRFVKKTGGFNEFDSISDDTDADLRTSLQQGQEQGQGQEQESQNGGVGRGTVETISGLKTSSKPQAPARRRHLRAGRSTSHPDDSSTPCTGPDPAVAEFINKIHAWAFSTPNSPRPWVPDIKKAFITSLNQVLKDEGAKGDLTISITDLSLKEDLKLTNMFAECIHEDNVKVTSDCEMQLQGQVSLTKGSPAGEPSKATPFFVDRISGRLSFLLNTDDRSVIIKLDGWPEICVAVPSSSEGTPTSGVGDAIASGIRNCCTEFNYGTLTLADPGFPVHSKFSPKKEALKYLLLTVIKGRDLGVLKGCQEAYAAIELDDPPQKFQTDVVRSHDPVWNENFVFNILPNGGGELLFEVHDKVGARFLGCNIISVDEIKTSASSGGGVGGCGGRMETLKLKSRKMEDSDGYSGSIDVQFTTLSEPEYLTRSRNKGQSLCMTSNTRAVFTRSPDSKVSSAAFTENVIKELGKTVQSNANKSTLVIHAVLRDRAANGEDPSESVAITQYGDERGRRKTRKGDIFTSIRRRLSKGRSHSVMGGDKSPIPGEDGKTSTTGDGGAGGDSFLQRSISADRQSMASTAANRLVGLGSARSSTSELSGISGFSTTTFVHENSTLVIECVENRVKKYFLVPPNLAESGRYRKKGKKLHIYNDHTFLAKHVSSGTMCEICTQRLPFSIGKQGYQCRDCGMLCHKECHVRAPSFCPKTSIYDIELSSVKPLEVKSTPRRPSSHGLFSSIFGGGRSTNKVGGVTNKSGSGSDLINPAFIEGDEVAGENGDKVKEKKKKSNIFRKMTRLGKISEENLASKERLLEIDPGTTNTNDQKEQDQKISEQEQEEEKAEEKVGENDTKDPLTLTPVEQEEGNDLKKEEDEDTPPTPKLTNNCIGQ